MVAQSGFCQRLFLRGPTSFVFFRGLGSLYAPEYLGSVHEVKLHRHHRRHITRVSEMFACDAATSMRQCKEVLSLIFPLPAMLLLLGVVIKQTYCRFSQCKLGQSLLRYNLGTDQDERHTIARTTTGSNEEYVWIVLRPGAGPRQTQL